MMLGAFIRAISALCLALILTGCSEDIIGNLTQKDMLDAQVLLQRAGIEVVATKGEDGRYTISGPADARVKALEVLTSQGLPRNEHASVAEVFPGGGFLVTPFEQKVRMRYAIEQQMSETLSSLEGVAEARVQVVLPEDNGRGLIREKARASVLLKYRSGADVPALETRSRALVVNGIQGLAYEDISVVASPWQMGTETPPANGADTDSSTEAVEKGGWLPSFISFNLRTAFITLAVMLAIGAGALLLMPRREENR